MTSDTFRPALYLEIFNGTLATGKLGFSYILIFIGYVGVFFSYSDIYSIFFDGRFF